VHIPANVDVTQDMHKQANLAIRNSQQGLTEKEVLSSDDGTTKFNSIFENILASKNLSAEEKVARRIAQEAFVVLVAGGETTARVLTTATYHLLANKETSLLRLKEELVSVMVDPDTEPDVKTLERLPWMVSLFIQTIDDRC